MVSNSITIEHSKDFLITKEVISYFVELVETALIPYKNDMKHYGLKIQIECESGDYTFDSKESFQTQCPVFESFSSYIVLAMCDNGLYVDEINVSISSFMSNSDIILRCGSQNKITNETLLKQLSDNVRTYISLNDLDNAVEIPPKSNTRWYDNPSLLFVIKAISALGGIGGLALLVGFIAKLFK